MRPQLIDGFLLVLTFALGALLSRVSLCAVAAVQQFIIGRDLAGLNRLLLAAGGAGLMLLLLAGLAPDHVLLPARAPLHSGVFIGGLLLGLGALINGGCYLGSVLYLGTGNLNFLFTLAGIALGLHETASILTGTVSTETGLRMSMGAEWLSGVVGFAALILFAMRTQRLAERWIVLSLGLLAGIVYARHPGWSYGALLQSLLQGQSGLMHWRDNLAALLLFAGAVIGALLAGHLRWQRPTVRRSLRCAAGGFIMGCGAALVPGGNDTLLLWAIPGLTVNGALAFAVMLAVIAAGFALAARRPGSATAEPTPAK